MIKEIKNIILSENLKINLNQSDEIVIKKFQEKVDWLEISSNQNLSEQFIEKFQEKVDWWGISCNQNLSEQFIEKFKDKVYWRWISYGQKLSEQFIEKFQEKVDWEWISHDQKLSEQFIEKFQDKVYWSRISKNQKLSEQFIKKFKDKVDWCWISRYQKLSEQFIEKFKNKVYWEEIGQYQKLSKKFAKKHKIILPTKTNMFYFNSEQKLEILNSGEGNPYEMEGEYIIAYKSTRENGYSAFNFQYKYEVGNTYESHANGNLDEENSFGLSAWTKEGALKHKSNGELYKVKLHIDDVVAIVHEKKKLRCTKIEIVEKIK